MRMSLAVAVLVSALAAQAPQPGSADDRQPVVVFETEKGAIHIDADIRHAPLTAANFLSYVYGKFYDGGSVIRAVDPDNSARRDLAIEVDYSHVDPHRRPRH